MGTPGTPKAVQADVAARRAKACQMRRDGHTWQEIADTLGLGSRSEAYNDVARALDEARKELRESAEQFRELELERLDNLERTVREVLAKQHVHVSASGRVVKGDDGVTIVDDGPTLQAVDRLLKIAERRSRLLGLDSAQKVEHSGQVLYAVEGVNVEKLT